MKCIDKEYYWAIYYHFQVLKTIPWEQVNIRILGVEIVHAGQVFDGSEEEITKLLEANKYIYKVLSIHPKKG